MLRIFLDALVVGMSIALLLHFALIWHYGRFYITESNKFILAGETLLMLIILGFGLYWTVKDMKE